MRRHLPAALPSHPPLGHGVGLRTTHFQAFTSGRPAVDWVEAISENFMAAGGRPLAVLEQVRRDRPVVLHGVSLAVGSLDPLPEPYLSALARLIRRVEPALVSDHLCWGTHRGQRLHDLLPLPYTEEALDHVAARVHAVQERLGRPLLLENPSAYLAWRHADMAEWEFLAALVRRTGCGLLLDVNNVVVSAHNLGLDPLAWLDGLPLEAVGYLHLAGHADHGRYLLDTHGQAVPPPVAALHREVVRRAGPLPTLVEWDEAVPPLEVLVGERDRAAAREREVLAARRLAS